MATFTPQTQLTPEQVFWSIDLEKRKAKELKANAPPLPVLPPAIVYPPNTPVHLVPRTLPTTSQVNISLYVITQLFWDFEKTYKKRITPTGITEGEREHFDGVQKSLVTKVRAMKAVFENLEAEVDQNEIDLKSGEIKRKNLLITNENLIAECLSKDVFYTVTDYILNVSRFSNMHDVFTIAQKRIADFESKNFNLRNKVQNDDHDSMIKHFSKLEVEHFTLQLKYQNLKESFGNKKPVTSSDAPSFDSLFVIGKLNKHIQRVNGALIAGRSKPRSNTKKDRTLPAKSALKQVEAHSRMNKSNEKQKNRVDSSISYKRTIINSNSNTSCKTCNKCLISVNHDQCVVRSGMFVKQSPATKCPLVRSTALKSNCMPADLQETIALVVQIVLWYLDSGCSKHMTGDRFRLRNFMKKFIGTVRFGNDHFGAIMGYGYYVIDLEVAFRKHTCFVRDLDGVDLIKGSRGTNLYTISVEDMMRSSPICLLSKASKNKS
ncbi:hypothetical protein Tco_1142927 [Tanacetum coccineum]